MNKSFAIKILTAVFENSVRCDFSHRFFFLFKRVSFFFFVTGIFAATAQQLLPEPKPPKRFIDEVEVIAGLGMYFPDDNGWYDHIKSESNGNINGHFKSRFGYLFGFGITHSIGNHFEINGRITWDRKGYLQENVTTGNSNSVYKYEANAQNDYLTGIIAPNVFIGKKRKFYISSGIFFSHLLKSLIQETSYLNNQITQRSSITNSPEINEYDVGILLAIGYYFQINSKYRLDFRPQFNYGLTDIINVNGLVLDSNSLNLNITLKYKR